MGVEIGYSIAFMAGIMGAWHCFGMCGGYAAGYFAGHGWSGKITPHLIYHGVRIASYVLMGVVGALLGQVLVQTGLFGKGQGVLFIIGGALIVLIGISLTGIFARNKPGPQQDRSIASHRVRFDDWPRGRTYLPLAAGLVNGLVPCTLVFSIAIKAVATGDPLQSGLLMLCFGIGTLPAMLLATATGALIGEKTRGVFAGLTGILVILFGAWTLYEGIVFYDIMRGLSN
jgi:sulfite exporter TauE/SafE